MTNPIAQVEDGIIALLTPWVAAAPAPVMIDTIPDRLDIDELTRVLRGAPGLYVAFLGARRIDAAGLQLDSKWAVYAVAAHAAGEAQRRRGDQTAIGAYDLVTAAAAALEHQTLAGIGTLALESIEHLPAQAFEKAGRTVFGLTFALPMALTYGADALATPPPMLTWTATYEFGPDQAAADTLTLTGA